LRFKYSFILDIRFVVPEWSYRGPSDLVSGKSLDSRSILAGKKDVHRHARMFAGFEMNVDFKVYLITDRKQTKVPLPQAVRLALHGGVRAIQLRERDLPIRELLALAQDMRSLTKEYGAKLFINDRVDVAIAADADGVHLAHQSMPPGAVRRVVGDRMLIGVSTHTIEEAKAAEAGGADFITFGPVFPTPSKAAFGSPVGLNSLKNTKNAVRIPIFGLGGIKSGNIEHVFSSGADGIAMISEIFGADDIQRAAEDVIRVSQNHVR
jgi:thiamine-phosphate pyrophosphorylase